MIDKYQTLMKGLSIDALSAFVSAFKSQLFVEGLVQGNFTSRVSAALAVPLLTLAVTTLGSDAASALAVWSPVGTGQLHLQHLRSAGGDRPVAVHSCQFEQKFPGIWI